MTDLDVLIFGGGAAGLWSLDAVRRRGYRAALLESSRLGTGQTIQAQGIIHGGGKYLLRGVRDFDAVRAVQAMPARWRRSLRGETLPDLSETRVLAERCHLWLPKRSLAARLQAWGFLDVVAQAGLLASPLQRLPAPEWPEALRGSAAGVYALDEPVLETGSLLAALAAPHRRFILRYDPSGLRFDPEGSVRLSSPAIVFRPRLTVLAAGEGNAGLLQRAGLDPGLMQRRPLTMVLLKGRLPPLWGHCVAGGKTRLTVTTAMADGETVWQVGGELAERHADTKDAARELRRWLPGLDLSGVCMATYRAVRAEARDPEGRRPSGVHVSRVAPRILAAWPTKLALAPLLADEVLEEVEREIKTPLPEEPALPETEAPPVASYPWEEAQWFPVP